MAIINIGNILNKIEKMGHSEVLEYKRNVFLSTCDGNEKILLINACDDRIDQVSRHSPLVEFTELNDFGEQYES